MYPIIIGPLVASHCCRAHTQLTTHTTHTTHSTHRAQIYSNGLHSNCSDDDNDSDDYDDDGADDDDGDSFDDIFDSTMCTLPTHSDGRLTKRNYQNRTTITIQDGQSSPKCIDMHITSANLCVVFLNFY